jgi:hypothetical protein
MFRLRNQKMTKLGLLFGSVRRFTIRRQFANLVTSALLGLFTVLIASCQPTEQKSPPLRSSIPDKEPVVESDSPEPFGFKCAWLAIKTEDSPAVAQALGLQNGRKCGWQKGIAAAYAGDVFVTPPIKGWVLAVSFSLPEIHGNTRPDKLSPLVKMLSEKFAEVQYFGTHRVVEYHGRTR